MASTKDIQLELEKLKETYKEEVKKKQKELAKARRQERDKLIRDVGRMALSTFPDLKTEDDFKRLFEIVKNQRKNHNAE